MPTSLGAWGMNRTCALGILRFLGIACLVSRLRICCKTPTPAIPTWLCACNTYSQQSMQHTITHGFVSEQGSLRRSPPLFFKSGFPCGFLTAAATRHGTISHLLRSWPVKLFAWRGACSSMPRASAFATRWDLPTPGARVFPQIAERGSNY